MPIGNFLLYTLRTSCHFPQYPCFTDIKPECRMRICLNQSVLCMGKELDEIMPEAIEGAKLLLSQDFNLSNAMETYKTSAIKKNVNLDRLYTLKILE